MRASERLRIRFWQGCNYALNAVWNALTDDELVKSVTPDQERLRSGVLGVLGDLVPDEDWLKPRLTNAQLAKKYAVSERVVTNWRKAECPFEEGQWRVLDWMSAMSTLQISDPAPLILDCQPERHRRVRCIWFVLRGSQPLGRLKMTTTSRVLP
jgi:hypothetical protein